mgnify:CR=1 FL=1
MAFDPSQSNAVDTLNGHFKESYADKIKDLIPEGVKFYNMVEFNSADKQPGNYYHQPVTLGLEHGFTYGGAAGSAFALNDAVASAHQDAQVRGHELVLRSYLSVAAASRSKSKNSFVQESKLLVQNMLKSMVRRMEVQLMYGKSGLGIVKTVSTTSITLESYEWAAGIWSGAENMLVDFYNGATLVLGGAKIANVDFDLKKLTFTTDVAAAGVLATHKVFYKGAKANEFDGLHSILSNTGSIFGIDAASYSLWKSNTVEVGTNFSGGEAVLSFKKVEAAIARGMEKGLADEEVTVICNPKSWNDLLTEQAAKRQYDSSYSENKIKQGAKEIEFHGAAGMIKIVSSIYCKEGYAYVICPKEFSRIGSSDITFEQPGFEGKFLKLLENANAYEMRCYTDQALFCAAPGVMSLLTFIKNDN